MTDKELEERLNSSHTPENILKVIKSMRDDFKDKAKEQMRFAEKWIENDKTLTEEQKKKFKKMLNIESSKLDIQF